MKCCFIGHRKIEINKSQIENLENIIENLIKKGYNEFIFGSNSEFNDLCHNIVTKLKEKYPQIERVCYTCKSEGFILESEREYFEELASKFTNKHVKLKGYEKEVEFKNKYTAGRASYIERNEQMILDSDFCIIYYNDSYEPAVNKRYSSKNSGTKLSYNYIIRKKKKYVNIFNE